MAEGKGGCPHADVLGSCRPHMPGQRSGQSPYLVFLTPARNRQGLDAQSGLAWVVCYMEKREPARAGHLLSVGPSSCHGCFRGPPRSMLRPRNLKKPYRRFTGKTYPTPGPAIFLILKRISIYLFMSLCTWLQVPADAPRHCSYRQL